MKYSTDRRTHSILEDILRAVVVPAFVADRNFHIISANSRFMSTCLLGSGNRTGSMGRIDSFLPSPGVLEKLDSVFSSGLAMEPVETACETEDGAKKSIRVAAGLLNGIDPGARYLLVTLEDTSARRKVEEQLSQEQKLGAIGSLAAGIAHEINTPIQYIGDNTRFLSDAFGDLRELFKSCGELTGEEEGIRTVSQTLINRIAASAEKADLTYIAAEIPVAIEQTLEGIGQVARIIRAIKEFAHPDEAEQVLTDLNRRLDSTITVSRNEWKYVADLKTELDPGLPMIPCYPGDLNQVFLNIIVNAAQAIGEKQNEESWSKGEIRVSSKSTKNWVVIEISDNGPGIPAGIRHRIFDPFFTTKDVGKGTGQGLAIAHTIIVDKHNGMIDVDSGPGKGTVFSIKLPVEGRINNPDRKENIELKG